MISKFSIAVMASLALIMVSRETLAAPVVFNVDGVITKPDGTALEEASVAFTIEILSPASKGSCLLYREYFTVPMTASSGYFSIPVGTTTSTATPVYSLAQTLGNETSFSPVASCSSGTSYSPAADDDRQIRISFTDTAGPHLFANQSIKAVPFAVRAKTSESVSGFSAGLLLKADSAVDQTLHTNTAMTQTQYDEFWRLILNPSVAYLTASGNAATATALATAPGACPAGQYMSAMTASGFITCSAPAGSVTSVTSTNAYLTVATGTSTPALTLHVGAVANTVAAGDDARFTDSRAPNGAAGGDLSGTYPNPSVAKISGAPVTVTAPVNGDVLQYSSGKFINAPISASDATKLPLTGGTMTGGIDMNSKDLTNVGYVTMMSGKSIHLSNNASDPSGLVATDKGKVWYNSTSKQVKYWDGSAAQPLGVASSGTTGKLSKFTAAGTIGDSVIAESSGNVGIGTTTPGALLDIGTAGTTLGTMRLEGNTSGYVQIQPAAAAGSWTMTLPATAGTNGFVLATDGSGVTSWVSAGGAGTVTNINAGTGLTGGPITSTGTLNVDVGTTAGKIVQLAAGAKYPAVDGSLIMNLTAGSLTGAVAIANGGTGQTTKTAAFDALSPNTTKGDLEVHNGTNNVRLPAGTIGQVLTADSAQATGLKWAAVDGSTITNLNANNISTGILPINRGGTGATSISANALVMGNVSGAAYAPFGCAVGEYATFNASGVTCGNANFGSSFVNGGNNFGIAATIGTSDNFDLNLKTGPSTKMTIKLNGNVGIGNPGPAVRLDVQGQILSREISVAGPNVDFTTGNTQVLSSVGGSNIALSGMLNGGQYTLVITDSTSRTYSFTGCTTVHAVPALAATSGQSVFSILNVSAGCYITWTTGF